MLGLLLTIVGSTGCGGDNPPPSQAISPPVAPEEPVKSKGKVAKGKKKAVDPDDEDDNISARRARFAREKAAREAAAKVQ